MKLSEAQRAVLLAAWEELGCEINFYQAFKAGGNGRTLHVLTEAGYLISRRYANGKLWELTDAGRRALAPTLPDRKGER